MKSIKNFENKVVANMTDVNGGARFSSGHTSGGNTRWDKIANNGDFKSNIGMFDGRRDRYS